MSMHLDLHGEHVRSAHSWRSALRDLLLSAAVVSVLACAVLVAPARASSPGGSGGVATKSVSGGQQAALPALPGGVPGGGGAEGRLSGIGFTCPAGQIWGFQNGVLKCALPTTLIVQAVAGKTFYVRANLIEGFVSGNLLRLTGENADLRLDLLDLGNNVVKSCFLNVTGKVCHMGLGGGANPGLAEEPTLPARTPAGSVVHAHADEMVLGGWTYMGSRAGGTYEDHYIVSARADGTSLSIQVAGLYALSNTKLLTAIYSAGAITLGALSGSPSETVFTLSVGTAAPLP